MRFSAASDGPIDSVATGLNRLARFMMDPRDARDHDEWFDVISSEDGVFGCIGMMGCQDVCPKELPLLEVYSYLRRNMLAAGLRGKGRLLGGSET